MKLILNKKKMMDLLKLKQELRKNRKKAIINLKKNLLKKNLKKKKEANFQEKMIIKRISILIKRNSRLFNMLRKF